MTNTIHKKEKNEEKKVLSVRMDKIDYYLLKKISKRKGVSLTSYANNILIKYINKNSEKIREKLNIDINGIRRQFLAESKGIKFTKELNEFERKAIDGMKEIFKTASEITEERLKLLLDLSQEALNKILFFNNELLKDKGLNLVFKLGKIVKV